MDELDHAIEDALGGSARADEIAEMIDALEIRRATLQRDLDAAVAAGDGQGRREWIARIRDAQRQIELLREEQAISSFVEASVRSAINRPRVRAYEDEA